jgi:hypothetical protein
MLVLLDCSPAKISALSEKYSYQFGQLRTPLTGYQYCERPYAIDNGCFSSFDRSGWDRLLQQARLSIPKPIFVTVPDVVGSARRTLELYRILEPDVSGFNRALVLQDGTEDMEIPWNKLEAIFIGGTDAFKESDSAKACRKAAKILGKWVHVGRVNTAARVKSFAGLADSIDGSGICKYDYMLDAVMCAISELPAMQRVGIRGMLLAEKGLADGESINVPGREKVDHDLFTHFRVTVGGEP